MGGFSEEESPPSLPVSPGATGQEEKPKAPGSRGRNRGGAGPARGQREGAAAPLVGGGGPPLCSGPSRGVAPTPGTGSKPPPERQCNKRDNGTKKGEEKGFQDARDC